MTKTKNSAVKAGIKKGVKNRNVVKDVEFTFKPVRSKTSKVAPVGAMVITSVKCTSVRVRYAYITYFDENGWKDTFGKAVITACYMFTDENMIRASFALKASCDNHNRMIGQKVAAERILLHFVDIPVSKNKKPKEAIVGYLAGLIAQQGANSATRVRSLLKKLGMQHCERYREFYDLVMHNYRFYRNQRKKSNADQLRLHI